MQKIAGLPKNVVILIDASYLAIENYEVISTYGLFGWILEIIDNEHWIEGHNTMLQQGFKFDAVMEQCIYELENHNRIFGNLIAKHILPGSDRVICWGFSDSEAGREATGWFLKKFRTCKNWDEFYNMLKMGSALRVELLRKIENYTWG